METKHFKTFQFYLKTKQKYVLPTAIQTNFTTLRELFAGGLVATSDLKK